MKKLLGCIAGCALMSTTVWAAETPDSIKEAFAQFLTTQTQLGTVFDTDKIMVEADGANFTVTIPAVESEGFTTVPHTLRLTEAGQFGEETQYKVEPVFETIQALFKDFIPEAVFTADEADVNLIWVPRHNLIVNNSQNMKGLNVNLPDLFELKIGTLVADSLTRQVADNKIDIADSKDASDTVITADTIRLSMPTVAYTSQTLGSDLTADAVAQVLSSDETKFTLSVPTLLATLWQNNETLALMALTAEGNMANNTAHLELHLDRMTFGQIIKASIPPMLVPMEMRLNIDVTDIDKAQIQQVMQDMQADLATPEDLQQKLSEMAVTAVIHINPLEIKNNEAGITVTGTVRNQFDEAGQIYPIVDATVVLKNLDKISPVPVVDDVQCNSVKQQMAAVTDQTMVEQAVQSACAPHGGILDDIRPYLDPEKRVVAEDGSTTDTITVTLDNGVLTLNGRAFQ